MISPVDKDSLLLEHPRADELFAYLYSYILFSEGVDIDGFDQREFGSVSAHVQAELDVWTASTDPRPLRPTHPSFRFGFSRHYDGAHWHFQPSGSKLCNIRFDSDRRGSQSIYTQIDVDDPSAAECPRILNIFSGNAELDFIVSQQLEKKHLRVLSVKGTGTLALLLPMSVDREHTVLPLHELSIAAKGFLPEQDNHASIPMSEFFKNFKSAS